jgi:hypothetical protein
MSANHSAEVAEISGGLGSSFFDTYLTLLSIIQGTTLAILLVKVDYLITMGPLFTATHRGD